MIDTYLLYSGNFCDLEQFMKIILVIDQLIQFDFFAIFIELEGRNDTDTSSLSGSLVFINVNLLHD